MNKPMPIVILSIVIELLREIEALDKAKILDTNSLGRTNIANLLAIKDLLT